MNAQEKWKRSYRDFKVTQNKKMLYRWGREAALERIVARQQREIEAQARQLKELGAAYDRMRDTVMDLTL